VRHPANLPRHLFQTPARLHDRPHVRPTDAPVNPRRGIVDGFLQNTQQIREELRGGEDAAERVEKIREQIQRLQERLNQANEQGDAA
jgi:hypothetical protein